MGGTFARPCTHSCVGRIGAELWRAHIHVQSRVYIEGAHTHRCVPNRNGAACLHVLAHACVCAESGRCVVTPTHTPTHRCASTRRHALAHTHIVGTPAHTLVCVQHQGGMPLHTLMCVQKPSGTFAHLHTLVCVQQQGNTFMHTLMVRTGTDHGRCVCTPCHTLVCMQERGGVLARPHAHPLMCA
jgi:hypothetical protein